MAKNTSSWVCTECGWSTSKWVGQCRGCEAWGTMEETAAAPPAASGPGRLRVVGGTAAPLRKAEPITEVSVVEARAQASGMNEVDRVLGGGIVPGAVILLAGEPGVGKSTLLLQVAGARAAAGEKVLYITGEESAAQVKLRAERLGTLPAGLLLAAENDLSQIGAQVRHAQPKMVIVDSVQTCFDPEATGQAGGVNQVRAVAAGLIALAKELAIPMWLVGHVTKDGGIAGPRVLEHLVDVVCQFEGERNGRLRLLRAVKNRYGPTDEVGCFDLGEQGLEELPDPSGLFLSHSPQAVPGTCVTVTLEGRRPMPTEVQALVTASAGGSPRRTTSGLDYSRTAMCLAVLQARARVDAGSADVYVSTVGGAQTREPAADLAIALALASAWHNKPIDSHLVAAGEVSLTGEIRPVLGVDRRLAEAARLGFKRAIVPAQGAASIKAPGSIELIPVISLADAIAIALKED